ncbi:OLC1v1030070C2 [Oldenlandia corymbosa var. corymbosa]|nr:OLC1v1030070C2 [Oldenlandia corymbosa var. corymbosa]
MSSAYATRISAFVPVPAATTPPQKFHLQSISSSITLNKQVLQFPKEQQAWLSISFKIVDVNNLNKHARRTSSMKLFAASSSSSSSPVEEVVSEEGDQETTDDSIDSSSSTSATFSGCQGCGKEEIERGCNGEGRIQGGIATVPGFGWWPIKAYRPCPSYVATGGRYRRTGQSMDEIGFGGGGGGGRKASSAVGNGENGQTR